MTCFKEDSIVFTLQNGDEESAVNLIRKIYASSEDPYEIMNDLKGK